jgi:SAM-dependent methyltransferase
MTVPTTGGGPSVGEELNIPQQVADAIRCPVCARTMTVMSVPSPGFTCSEGHVITEHDGYLDASVNQKADGNTSRTFESFGYEWTTFDDVRPEDVEFSKVYFKDLDMSSLNGKIGLDAGCGKGRYTRFLAPNLGALVALDGSDAVLSAVKNLSQFDNVTVVRSDLRHAPFAPRSFGFISSLGVLHHLDDPEAGFRGLVSLLAPGGSILVYLYSRPSDFGVRRIALSMSAAVRRATVRMPHNVLKPVSYLIAILLKLTMVGPGELGDRKKIGFLSGLPMSAYRRKPFRSLELDTFDRLSAPVENRYVWNDLKPWFQSAGLVVDAARDEAGWFVLAHLPRIDPT